RSMQMLLAYNVIQADRSTVISRQAAMLTLMLDGVLWIGIMAAVWVTVLAVRRWLWGEVPEEAPAEVPQPAKGAKAKVEPAKPRSGWPALAVTTVVALLVIWSTISRTPVAMVARGQVIASVAGALYLGAMAARYFTGIDDTFWYVVAVPLVCLIG